MVSVVVPIYNEEENIGAFHTTVSKVMDTIQEAWEIVYVNDGSRDSSLELLLDIQKRDSRVIVVEFSRNFGHQAALTAGLQTAKGDCIMLMDGDFQDPPEVLPRLVEAWKNGAKVVIAERTRRAEKGIRGRLFPLFYKIMGLISDFPIPLNAGIFGLLDRSLQMPSLTCRKETAIFRDCVPGWAIQLLLSIMSRPIAQQASPIRRCLNFSNMPWTPSSASAISLCAWA